MYNYVNGWWGDGVECREYIVALLGVTDPEVANELSKHARICAVCKGELIQKSGEESHYTSFLLRGLFRGYYLDFKGTDVTDCFATTPGSALVSSLGLEEPSCINIEALEDGEVLSIPTDILVRQIAENKELLLKYNMLLKEALKMHWENKTAVTNRSASARYLWFQQEFPGLIDQVSHKYVASFLGMTPVSLSRVRRAMRSKE